MVGKRTIKKSKDSSDQANKARAGKRNESVDSLDRDMGTKQGMLNSNKKECHLEHFHFPPSTQLTYSIDLTDRVTKEINKIHASTYPF